MKTFVPDASIAIKWVIEENGSREALTLLQRVKLIAPELLVAEYANILWKKIQRNELSQGQAFLAARLLQSAADEHFLRKVNQGRGRLFAGSAIGLHKQ